MLMNSDLAYSYIGLHIQVCIGLCKSQVQHKVHTILTSMAVLLPHAHRSGDASVLA